MDHLHRYGMRPTDDDLPEVRRILHDQAQLDQMYQDTELMKSCCIQLFHAAQPADVRAIWLAKESSFDAHCSIDVQLLCGAGLEATKAQLRADGPADALSYLLECEAAGDFANFTVAEWAHSYDEYFLAEEVEPADLAELRAAFQVDGGESALGWEGVRAFEREQGVILPEPYRTFVAEITDGSVSGPPRFGLLGLAELPGDWGDDRADRVLSRPFPLDEPSPEELAPVFNAGSIVLGTEGDGEYWLLIVTGPHRGQIWNVSGSGAAPFGATAGSGFLGWVRHWAPGKPYRACR